VAIATVAAYVRVIEIRWRPRHCCMAIIAVVAAGDMRRMFSCSNRAVMARTTSANDLRVINVESRYPRIRRMTVFAHVAGLNVCRVLASRICTVVAARAISRDVHVVKVGRQPPGR